MNNSRIAIDNVRLEVESPVDTAPMIRERVAKLELIIESFEKICESKYWKVLETEIFSGVLEALQRRMRNEKDTTELFRLQGQEMWANKYCNFATLAEGYRKEISNLTNKLNETPN